MARKEVLQPRWVEPRPPIETSSPCSSLMPPYLEVSRAPPVVASCSQLLYRTSCLPPLAFGKAPFIVFTTPPLMLPLVSEKDPKVMFNESSLFSYSSAWASGLLCRPPLDRGHARQHRHLHTASIGYQWSGWDRTPHRDHIILMF